MVSVSSIQKHMGDTNVSHRRQGDAAKGIMSLGSNTFTYKHSHGKSTNSDQLFISYKTYPNETNGLGLSWNNKNFIDHKNNKHQTPAKLITVPWDPWDRYIYPYLVPWIRHGSVKSSSVRGASVLDFPVATA